MISPPTTTSTGAAAAHGGRARRRARRRDRRRGCTSRPRGLRGDHRTARRSATTCSARAGAATSGGCATAATTSPTCSRTRTGAGRRARQRLVPRPARPGAGSGRCTATGSACIAQLEVDVRRRAPQVVVTDDTWTAGPSDVVADDLYDGQTIDARLARRRLDAARCRRRPAGSASRSLDFDTGRLAPYVGPPVRRVSETLRPVEIWTSPSGPHAGRLRAEPRRLAAVHACAGEAGQRDHRPARRGARGRRARRPPAAHRQGHRPVRAQRRRRRLRADLHLPRLPLRRGRRLAGRARPPTPRGRGRALRPAPHRHLRVLRRRCSTSCTATSSGACRATSSTSPPTARSATSGSAGPATSRCSRPTAAFLYDVDGFLARLAGRPRRSSSRPPTGMVPFVVPDVLKYVRAPDRSSRRPDSHGDLERRGGVGAVGAVAGVRRPTGAASASTTRWPRTCAGSSRCCRRPACGTRASSSATGSTRTRRRTSRSRPRPTTAWWPPPACYRTRAHRRRGGRAARARRRRRALRGARRPDPRGVPRALRRTPTARIEQRLPPRSTRWRSSSACSTSAAPAAGRRPAGRAGRRERLPHRHRVRRDAVRHATR